MGEIIDKLQGKMKQVQGDITGDSTKHAEGVVQELKGKVEGKLDDLKHAIKETAGKIDEAAHQTDKP